MGCNSQLQIEGFFTAGMPNPRVHYLRDHRSGELVKYSAQDSLTRNTAQARAGDPLHPEYTYSCTHARTPLTPGRRKAGMPSAAIVRPMH